MPSLQWWRMCQQAQGTQAHLGLLAAVAAPGLQTLQGVLSFAWIWVAGMALRQAGTGCLKGPALVWRAAATRTT